MDRVVLDLLKRSAAVPSMPQVATRFLQIIQDPDFDYREVVAVLSSDPGTVSEILRLANSSLFGVTRKVTALPHAVSLLGIKRVRSLVLGRYIVDSLNRRGCGRIKPSYYWRRSLTTAVLSARLIDALAPELREEAFVAGLLADIGVVILGDAMPEQYGPIAEQYRPGGQMDLAAAEQATISATHAEVSGLVLEHWRLPENICEAVQWHSWALVRDSGSVLALVIGAADRISKYLCEAPEDINKVVEDCQAIITRLNLDPATLSRSLEEIEHQIEDLSDMLRIEVIPSQVYEVIATQVRKRFAETATADELAGAKPGLR
jgi:HD-like signal output (HDOD) protein